MVLPELHISDDDMAALARLLGDVVLPPHGALADHPEISPITRDPAQDKLAQYREANVNWHTDGTMSEVPDKLTMLTADPHGRSGEGNTEFANTYAAYRALPDDDKALIDGLRVRHSFASAHRKIEPDPSEKQLAQWAMVPTREHPLVWKRKDGRRSLVMGSTAEAVLDMPDDEGQALLQPAARLGDTAAVHAVAFVARRRPRDLRQHGPAAPGDAVRRRLTTADAPRHRRRRRSLRLTGPSSRT